MARTMPKGISVSEDVFHGTYQKNFSPSVDIEQTIR